MVRASYNESNFSLARMKRLLTALGDPHRRFKSVHIAGTKGKGSTATMLAEMVRACGVKVGLYMSPHVVDIRERITVSGQMISERDFGRAIAAVAAIAAKARVPEPTYFEVLTAAAFHHFALAGVELAVVETGLGGRLDSTNVIQPEVVGITSISYDHMQQLGNTLPQIAREKAGVMKAQVPAVSAFQVASVKETLRAAAAEAGAPLRFADEDFEFTYRFEHSRALGRHARICLTTPNCRFEHLHVPLLGEHQAMNCGLALTLLDVLKTRGFPINEHKAMEGLAQVRLPGRMEIICEQPRVLVDGAHNAASVAALMRAVGQNIPYDSMIVIFGCNRDKDVAGMIQQVQLGADKIIFCSTGSPRSADPAELAAEYIERCGKMAQVAQNLEHALQIALGAVTREDLICITGSFYLVGEAKRRFAAKPELRAEVGTPV
ncbi:MAG TPA: folylpolyglutamate synthase/dihydrofolate synthase family protein [Phycisphaerae bacterium]|nr:folylpolyglutamate synthase/dihydrofolate synthase family protein [Phycisphaerae bacterium]HNU44040.1 folylpolyglutamate synthase/dihydrofolate synthase family protein [Phycisphaerae bacterium]